MLQKKWVMKRSATQPVSAEDESKLQVAEALYKKLVDSYLKEDKPWTDQRQRSDFLLQYRDLVHKMRVLEVDQDKFPEDFQTRIRELGEQIKDRYQDDTRVRQAINGLESDKFRDAVDAFVKLKENFPSDERWVAPTRLGNVMGALESHTLERYGITLSTIWSRLIYVLPDSAHSSVEEAKIYLDFTIIMSFVSLLVTMIAVFGSFHDSSRGLLSRIIPPCVCLFSWWLFYLLAIQAARAYGTQLHAVVDLYRLKLLDALEFERPEKPGEEEEAIWKEIASFLVQAKPLQEPVHFKAVKTEGQPAVNSVAHAQTNSTQNPPPVH